MATDLDRPPAAVGGDDPFAALTRHLTDLDYTPGDVVDGITTYAHPDGGGGVLATIDYATQEARLNRRNDDGDPTWMIRITGDTPPAVQVITLYAALHAGNGDEKTILRTIAVALDLPPDGA